MSTIRARRPNEPPSDLPVAVPISARRRFALTVRERRVVLAIGDFAIGAVACYVAYELFSRRPTAHPLAFYDPLIVGAVWVLALLVTDGYAFRIPSDRVESGVAVIKALPIAALLSFLIFFLRPYVLTRPVIVGTVVLGAAAIALVRLTAARFLLHETLAVQAVLVSDADPSADVVAALRAGRFEYRIVGTVIHPAATDVDRDSLLDEARDMLGRTGAEELIVTNNELRLLPGLVEECLTHDVRLVSANDLVERYLSRVPIDSIDVHWYLSLPDSDVWRRPYAAARRVTDLLLAFVLSIPFVVLLPVLAVLIKLDSRGPVFLVQRRIGERGREFDLVKLRTMTADAEKGGAQYAAQHDPRVTRFGRVLRAVRLDEAPQMINIMRGEMSFIGPRPERPEFEEQLEAEIPHFRSRLLVKPGLTGWAQIKGGYASTVQETTRKLEYDLYYIKNRSFRLDVQILGSTFWTVVRRRGR